MCRVRLTVTDKSSFLESGILLYFISRSEFMDSLLMYVRLSYILNLVCIHRSVQSLHFPINSLLIRRSITCIFQIFWISVSAYLKLLSIVYCFHDQMHFWSVHLVLILCVLSLIQRTLRVQYIGVRFSLSLYYRYCRTLDFTISLIHVTDRTDLWLFSCTLALK